MKTTYGTNKLKIRILSETSLLYLIRRASFILIVSLHLKRCIRQQANIVGRKKGAHSGLEPAAFGLQASAWNLNIYCTVL